MKSRLLFFLAAIGYCILSDGIAAEPVRTWTNREGETVRARMLSSAKDTVTILLPNGRTYILSIASLSDDDQAYVKKQSGPSVSPPSGGWFEDADKARMLARELDRPVLMLFTGSDWCGYCIRLEDNVLSKGEFEKFAEENLVRLIVDFPRRDKQSKARRSANGELQKEYGVRGYPTLFLTDADGEVLSRFGYGGQSAEEFVSLLEDTLP